MAGDPSEAARARLAWRCRRGTRELDLLLQRWLQQAYAGADERQRALFEGLLELPDPELADLLLAGLQPAEPALAALVQAIRFPGPAPARSSHDSNVQAPGRSVAVLCPTGVTGTSDLPGGQTAACTTQASGRGQSR